ncbi:MAG: ABC transporter permease, partial [Blastocatellia bacterium]
MSRQALKLFNQFVLRSLARQKLRSAVTVLGISLGVAVVIAIRLANAGSLESFRAATVSVAGQTSLTITGSAGRFDETLLANLGWLRDYGEVSPVIDGYALAEDPGNPGHGNQDHGELQGDFLHILGVDILHDRPLREYQLLRLSQGEGQPSARDFLLLLADPNAIVVTEKFARARGVSIGGTLTLDIGDSQRKLTVRGLLLDSGPARALDGRFAIMDIAAAQWAFDRLGYLDRVDLRLKPGLKIEDARREIGQKLPAGLTVAAPDEQYGQVEKMIAAFHFNLSALGS